MSVTISSIIFFEKLENALNMGMPFTAYKLPGSSEVRAFFQRNKALNYTDNYNLSGFVFAPFDNVKPTIVFPLEDSDVYTTQFIEDKLSVIVPNKDFSHQTEETKFAYINLVKNAIDFLKTTKNLKVVLSRKELFAVDDFELLATFKKLLSTYKNAMVYVWFHPKVGLWLGATPEALLKVNNDKFSTMSLAGTQVYKDNKNVVWQDKEVQEQQFVTDFILAQIEVDVTVSKPYTIKAGNILHICTDISGQITAKLSLDGLLKNLHPTPAVCGLPQKRAKAFILDIENYDRTFYTGFFGELNINNRSNLFVNLRCMQVLKTGIEIYVGGGITIDSNPEKEWEETVVKSKVMLKVLN